MPHSVFVVEDKDKLAGSAGALRSVFVVEDKEKQVKCAGVH